MSKSNRTHLKLIEYANFLGGNIEEVIWSRYFYCNNNFWFQHIPPKFVHELSRTMFRLDFKNNIK